jgi:hypothetical protein
MLYKIRNWEIMAKKMCSLDVYYNKKSTGNPKTDDEDVEYTVRLQDGDTGIYDCMDTGAYLEFSHDTANPKKFSWMISNLYMFGIFALILMIASIQTYKAELEKV